MCIRDRDSYAKMAAQVHEKYGAELRTTGAIGFSAMMHGYMPVSYTHLMEACKEKNVVVCNCAGYSTAAVADLVFGLLISLYRHIQECGQKIRQGGTKEGLIGPELEGKKFGVIEMCIRDSLQSAGE